MAGKEQGAARAPGRGIRIALAVSLALNLAVVGVVGGSLLGGEGRPGNPMVRDIGFGPFTAALSPEDRSTLGRAFRDEAPDMRNMRADMRQIVQTLRATPFDEVALREAMAGMTVRGRTRLELGQRLLFDRLVAMTPQERDAFADRLQHVMERGRDRPRGDVGEGN